MADEGRLPMRRDLVLRVLLGCVGLAGIAYGVTRLYQSQPDQSVHLLEWMLAATLLNDVLIAPVVIAVGWAINHTVTPRVAVYVEGCLVSIGLVCSIALILVWRRGKTSSPALALLRQNYLANVLILIGLIAATSVASYVVSVARQNRTNSRPPARN
jgi:hypothetical protein